MPGLLASAAWCRRMAAMTPPSRVLTLAHENSTILCTFQNSSVPLCVNATLPSLCLLPHPQENDIILCDGMCNRAYHFKCLVGDCCTTVLCAHAGPAGPAEVAAWRCMLARDMTTCCAAWRSVRATRLAWHVQGTPSSIPMCSPGASPVTSSCRVCALLKV